MFTYFKAYTIILIIKLTWVTITELSKRPNISETLIDYTEI